MEAHAQPRGLADRAPESGILAWVATTDHKRIALRMAVVSGFFFLVGGVLALLIRTQLLEPGGVLFEQDAYNQVFTMHGSTMIFLVVTPLALALGVYLVPLQVGAADIAAPRLALAAHWLVLAGGLTMYSSFLTDHGAGKAGWTAYYPLSDDSATPGTGMDLWVIGVIIVGLGLTLLAVCLLATIIRLRAPGMTMLRVPVFTWTSLASSLMIVMSVPVLAVAMALLLAERLGAEIYNGSGGPIAYQNLFWFFGHPAVYIMFFPFLGITAEVVATFSRKRFFGYKPLILALLAFTGLSMSVWAHHMFTTGQVTNKYFALTSTALVVPAGMEYFAIIATMIGGAILLRTPMLFALGFFLQFLIGGLSGVFTAAPALDYHVHDSYFVVAHFHYTLFAGSLFAGFAAVYYWFPKWTGAMLRDGLGKLQFGLMLIGTNLTFFPMFLLGVDGMPRRIANYASEDGFQELNVIATIGSYFVALGVLVFLINLYVSLRNREPAGDDPWEGHTLEWATSSPPPRYNFASLPKITSFAPLMDQRVEKGEARVAQARLEAKGARMSGLRLGAVWIAGLGLWIGLLSLLMWLWVDDELAPALLTGGAVVLLLTAAYAATVTIEPTRPRRIAESSLATVAIAIGVAMAINGVTFGLFLILIGAQLAALGAAGLVIQHLADRRAGEPIVTAAHMVEHSILSGVVAPAIVLAWGALRLPALRVRHPLAAWSAFVVAQWVFHLTPLLADSQGAPVLHTAEHLVFIAIGVWFWIPILSPRGGLGDPGRSLYLFGAAPAIDLVGVMLMSRGDQAAGVAMIAGGLPIVIAAVVVTWSWLAREQREAKAMEARHVAAG